MVFQVSQRRIARQQKSGKSFFTSNLSTNEYLLAKESGCEPIGLVMGSSFYQVGNYQNLWGYRKITGEIEALTQAQLTARELAVSRLQQEAAQLGAHGVIGVQLKRRRKSWGIGMVEFTAIGTAIRIPGEPPTQSPFTSDLSGQEFWQLRQAGYRPQGLVFGTCSYYVHSDPATRNLMNRSIWNLIFGRGRQNQEIVQYTQGFEDARELAILRMTKDIQQHGAIGAVGMKIDISEEVIDYQPQTFTGCLFALLLLGGFPAVFILLFLGQGILLFQLVQFLMAYPILPWTVFVLAVSSSIWNSFTNTEPFRDLLTHFVAIGTAISEDKNLLSKQLSQTLMFYPLNKS
jgi:uncharacterized protein YbjQ (UPF0145 family)